MAELSNLTHQRNSRLLSDSFNSIHMSTLGGQQPSDPSRTSSICMSKSLDLATSGKKIRRNRAMKKTECVRHTAGQSDTDSGDQDIIPPRPPPPRYRQNGRTHVQSASPTADLSLTNRNTPTIPAKPSSYHPSPKSSANGLLTKTYSNSSNAHSEELLQETNNHSGATIGAGDGPITMSRLQQLLESSALHAHHEEKLRQATTANNVPADNQENLVQMLQTLVQELQEMQLYYTKVKRELRETRAELETLKMEQRVHNDTVTGSVKGMVAEILQDVCRAQKDKDAAILAYLTKQNSTASSNKVNNVTPRQENGLFWSREEMANGSSRLQQDNDAEDQLQVFQIYHSLQKSLRPEMSGRRTPLSGQDTPLRDRRDDFRRLVEEERSRRRHAEQRCQKLEQLINDHHKQASSSAQ